MNDTLWLPVLAGLLFLGGAFVGWALRRRVTVEDMTAAEFDAFRQRLTVSLRDNPNPEDQGA